ncbi:Exodeoxyribonuclease III [Candidatus Ecksteinia adelgidicola]|nr:Exodeoxyribonuclease III [Candidatus Ecksteinia adelgidicola]
MKIISFNVNGLRARFHQLAAIIDQHQPDIIGLQETKVHDDMFPLKEINKYGYYVCYHGQKGHFGVALLSKIPFLSINRGFETDEESAQRRIIMVNINTSHGQLTVINAYFPQGDNRYHQTKFPVKARFYQDLKIYLKKYLSKFMLVLVMGDMNVSHTDFDIGIGEKNKKKWLYKGKCSFLPEERTWLNHLFNWGLIDIYRYHHPFQKERFSWFDYRSQGFIENRGLRIDLLLTSMPLAKLCFSSGIDYNIRSMERPSDHAPVWAEFKLSYS